MATLLFGAIIYVDALSPQYSENKDFATGPSWEGYGFRCGRIGSGCIGKGNPVGALPEITVLATNTRLFSAWRHAAFHYAVENSCHVPPLPAPDSSQPANCLPFLNIDGCIVEQGGHCPVTGENRSKSLAGEGAAYARMGRAAVVRFTTW